MSIVPDMSDEGLVRQFGDVMFELPELFEALRRFELQSRPAVTSGGLKVRGSGVLVQCREGVLRVKVGHSRSME
jgi:hypothetical protein